VKVFIIHPGIQHSYRLANALRETALFDKVYLFTSVLYHFGKKPFLKSFQKRVKPIHADVIIKNHILYELISKTTRHIYNRLVVNPNKQVHNNPIYFWQFIFGLLCLPTIWWYRKDAILVTYETAAWPVVWFAKKWHIPVVMDFPSISHEKAKELGINETEFGMAIKKRERVYIDYALFCSDFCRKSFEGLSSSKEDFVLYLGAEKVEGGKWELGKVGKLEGESLDLKVRSPQSVKGSLLGGEMGGFDSAQPDIKREFDKFEGGLDSAQPDNNFDSYLPDSKRNSDQPDKKRQEVVIKISFIANLEFRKGLDILLEALYAYNYPCYLEVHLIGKIRKEWVQNHMPEKIINSHIKLVYQEAMSQQELFSYLQIESFDLNVQPSRFDSFAMVVPETMMQGIPNLVSPFVGAGEMLKDGIDGFKMKSLEANSLREAIHSFVIMNMEERQELEKEVLNSASKMTWKEYNVAVEKAFKEIINQIHS
jgi:glycosyltransferase involved in cell wall biosynthesis